MPISIDLRHDDNAAILVLSGRLTIGDSVQALHDRVETCVKSGDKDVVLDLRDVTYVDSAGLGALVTSLTCARNHGGTLKLANVQPRIQALLEVSTLFMVFQIIELASTKIGD